MAHTIGPKSNTTSQTPSQQAPTTSRTPQRTATVASQEAPPSYSEALGSADAFNAPRYTPRRTPQQQAPALETPSNSSGASSRSSSHASSSSNAEATKLKSRNKTAQQARDVLKNAWEPVAGIHYYDGVTPLTSSTHVEFQAYRPNPKQTRGEALEQRKLETQWIANMGAHQPFPGNARAILQEDARWHAEYGGPERIRGKLSTFGKMTQKLAGKGKSRTQEQDAAAYNARFSPTPGIEYFSGGTSREVDGIAYQPYVPNPNQSKKEAIRERKLEARWLEMMPGEPFPGNARSILQNEIDNEIDPFVVHPKLP